MSDRILIVEDSPTQASHLRFLLEEGGYQVTVAANGQEGLASVRVRKPDLIIADIVMPVMDGYEMCHSLKQEEAFRYIPVMLLTTLSDPSAIVRGLEAGADHYLTKPYDRDRLLSRVESALADPVQEAGEGAEDELEVAFASERHVISASRRRVFNFLLAAYEDAVQQNRQLVVAQRELRSLKEQLEDRVKERTSDLHAEIAERKRAEEEMTRRVQELEYFHRLVVGRELRMVELKRQVNELSEQLGEKPPYDVSFAEEDPSPTANERKKNGKL